MAGVVLVLGALGCPGSRPDGGLAGDSGASPPSAAASTAVPAPASPRPSIDLSTSEEPPAPALAPGVALPPDGQPTEEAWGVELTLEVRPRPSGPAAARPASLGVVRIVAADGRARARFGPHGFGFGDGAELRAERSRAGWILVPPSLPLVYRVVPPGALRVLLGERRADVLPLAATRLGPTEPITRLGRQGEAVTVTTSYGWLRIEQIVAPVPPRAFAPTPPHVPRPPPPLSDAGAGAEPRVSGVDGAGEPICRLLLELLASDRVLGGKPCAMDSIPVFGEVAFSNGGGLIFEVTSIREGAVARADIAFPPADARLSTTALPLEDARPLLDPEGLLALHTKGEPAALELLNRSSQPRVAYVDGVPVLLSAPGRDRTLTLRAGRYSIEWRTAIGELADRAVDVDVPGRSSAGQVVSPSLPSPSPPSPLSPPSSSPMASARTGP